MKTYTVKSPTLHIGSVGVTLKRGQVIKSDGLSTVVINGKEVSVPAISGAIKVGWVVEGEHEFDEETPVESVAANPVKKMKVVKDEESQSRPMRLSESKPKVAKYEDDNEGVVVARIKSSASSGKVEIGKDDRAVLDKIERSKLNVEKVKVATVTTGDVEEATFGESLEEVLPNAEVAGKVRTPEPEVTITKTQEEPVSEAQIRQAKAEVLKLVYPDVEYKSDAPWRSRVRMVIKAYESSKNETILAAFVSIESNSVKVEIERALKKKAE